MQQERVLLMNSKSLQLLEKKKRNIKCVYLLHNSVTYILKSCPFTLWYN